MSISELFLLDQVSDSISYSEMCLIIWITVICYLYLRSVRDIMYSSKFYLDFASSKSCLSPLTKLCISA